MHFKDKPKLLWKLNGYIGRLAYIKGLDKASEQIPLSDITKKKFREFEEARIAAVSALERDIKAVRKMNRSEFTLATTGYK